MHYDIESADCASISSCAYEPHWLFWTEHEKDINRTVFNLCSRIGRLDLMAEVLSDIALHFEFIYNSFDAEKEFSQKRQVLAKMFLYCRKCLYKLMKKGRLVLFSELEGGLTREGTNKIDAGGEQRGNIRDVIFEALAMPKEFYAQCEIQEAYDYVRALDPYRAGLLQLHYAAGLSYREMEKRLDIPASTLRVHCDEALCALRKLLNKDGENTKD